tara:strand:+ start:207 stop:488 length:282 start_codon:yes stop_codon:yes gene_type:complete
MSKKESFPKYPSQIDEMNAIDKIFSKTLKQRDNIIKRNSKADRDIIRTLDLKISICIKKRAKVTKGGYNDIPTNMWEWKPYFSIDKRLLPKTV